MKNFTKYNDILLLITFNKALAGAALNNSDFYDIDFVNKSY